MPKLRVRGDTLSVTTPENIREAVSDYDGDEIDMRAEDGRIFLALTAVKPLPSETEALDEAEAESSDVKKT